MPDSNRNSTNLEENGNAHHVEIQVREPRRSLRRSRRRNSSRRSDSSAETITMQENSSAGQRQPVTLKASFLRRKIAEYEGKKKLRLLYRIFRQQSLCAVLYHINTNESIYFMIREIPHHINEHN